jgi:hypothetical protein
MSTTHTTHHKTTSHGKSTSSLSKSHANSSHAQPASKEARPQHASLHTSKVTTDHETIRKWAETRGGKPSAVKRTGSESDVGIIRIDFPGYSGENSLEEIAWDEFFDKFEDSKLAFVYQEETAEGVRSNFNKLVKRERAH